MPSFRPRFRFDLQAVLTLGAFLALVTFFVLYVRAEKSIDAAHVRRILSLELANELRQSSDDLTRMVRTYVITGDAEFKRRYEEILDIRHGRASRLGHDPGVGWGEVDTALRLPAAALIERMRQAGFAAEEFALLEVAKQNSDRLTATEREAMKMVEVSPGDPATRTRAVATLHDAAYHRAKAEIMSPIRQVVMLSNARTQRDVDAALGYADRMRLLLVSAGVLVLALLWSVRRALHSERRAIEASFRNSERRFRDMVDSTDGIVWEADARTFKFTFVSNQAERLLGFPVDDWYQPGFWVAHLHPDDRDWAPEYCASCTGRIEPHDFEYRFVAADGRTVWLHDIVTVVAEAGEPRWLRGIMVDITKAKRSAQELDEYRSRLEQLVDERTRELSAKNKQLEATLEQLRLAQRDLVEFSKLSSLGELVAGVAHELNTPIGNARMVASTLSEQCGEVAHRVEAADGIRRSELLAYFRKIETGAGLLESNLMRAAHLIQSFKQVAVDQTSSQRRSFDLRAVTEEVIATLHPKLKKLPVAVDNAIPAGIELDSYPGPYDQVIANLIDNALIHGLHERPEGRIRLDARVVGERVEIVVEDDGRGIAHEHQSRIFDPFFTTRLGQGGSGLGLNIVFNIVTGLLGGRIAVDSAPGQGARFTILMPLKAPDPARVRATIDAA